MNRAKIRCRFCSWSTVLWSGGRKPVSGWAKLSRHVFEDHPVEWQTIQDWLNRSASPEVRA